MTSEDVAIQVINGLKAIIPNTNRIFSVTTDNPRIICSFTETVAGGADDEVYSVNLQVVIDFYCDKDYVSTKTSIRGLLDSLGFVISSDRDVTGDNVYHAQITSVKKLYLI